MAGKFQLITELYEEAAREVGSDRKTWKEFLTTAGFNYNLRFDEQLLIYAQRPEASAVLEIGKWNNMFHRWVNRGARGIAVFDDSYEGKQRLKYYFDISDTHAGENAVPVPIWSMKPKYEQDVIKALGRAYGELSHSQDIFSAVICAGENSAEEQLDSYLTMLREESAGSIFSDLDADNQKASFQLLLSESVSYMIGKRLGIPMDETEYDFEQLGNFNTKGTLNILGFAVSDTAKQGLLEIAKTIRNLERQNCTFERKGQDGYNAEKDENEGRSSHEHNVYKERGADAPGSGDPRGTDRSERNLGDQTEELSEGGTQTSLLQPADLLSVGGAFGEMSAGGRRDDGGTLPAAGGAGARHREAESKRSGEVDRPDEQHQKVRRRDRKKRADRDLKHQGAGISDLPLDRKSVV